MNRFFRSAFFPLIVIVLLVWLASQTLMPKSTKSAKLTTSQVIGVVRTHQVTSADFNPSKRAITVKLVSGKTATVHYASDQAQLQFQKLLAEVQRRSSTRRAPAASRGGR